MFGKQKEKTARRYQELSQQMERLEQRMLALEIENRELKKAMAKLEQASGVKEAPVLSEKEQLIRQIMEKSGWDRNTVIQNVEDARKRLGINYTKYNNHNLHTIPAGEQAAAYLEILNRTKVTGKANRKKLKNEKLLMTVVANTGWSYNDAKAAMARAAEISGAEYKDYVAYRFWELPEEVQATYFTKGDANALRKKYNTSKDNIRFFMNKNEFNEKFEAFLGRPWACNIEMTPEAFQEKFAGQTRIIYKPLSDSCGHGVTVFDLTDDNLDEVYEKLVTLPQGVVEGYVVQHPEMSKFSRNSVNTVRVVSVYAFGKVHMLYAAMRMGGGESVVDNFHAGGVLALVDVSNGVLETEAIDLAGNFYANHPVTGEKILGFEIPFWKEAVQLIEKAGTVVPGVGYVGWDVAITENGPILIEGNTAPAPNVLQTPHAKTNRGMKHVVAKFL